MSTFVVGPLFSPGFGGDEGVLAFVLPGGVDVSCAGCPCSPWGVEVSRTQQTAR